MSEDETKIDDINRIFEEAKKEYVCPGCLSSFTRFDSLAEHREREIH